MSDSPATGAVLVLLGVWLVLRTVRGGLVEMILGSGSSGKPSDIKVARVGPVSQPFIQAGPVKVPAGPTTTHVGPIKIKTSGTQTTVGVGPIQVPIP